MRVILSGVLALFSFAGVQEPDPGGQAPSVWFAGDGETYPLDALPDDVDRLSEAALEKWFGHLAESDVAYTGEVLEGRQGVFVFAPEVVIPERKPRKGKGSTRADRRRKEEREKRKREKEEAARLEREGPPPPPEVIRRDHLRSVRELFEAKLPAPETRYRSTSIWGKDTLRARAEVPVLILVRDREDFQRVLDGVVETNPHLESYVAELKASLITGVIIESPLVGVVIQRPEDAEEHRPQHELVKRQVELLLFKRFGPLPFFVREGVAWCFEWEELGELRTFTGRTDFIGLGDPAYDGWPELRKLTFEPDKGMRLEDDREVMARLRKWRSDDYQDKLAAASYQVARCLLERHGDQISEILGRWGADVNEKRGTTATGGGWSLIPDFILGADDLVAGLRDVKLLESVRSLE